MGDSEEPDASHIKLHQMSTFPQGAIVKASYQPKIVGGTTAVIVSTATTHLQTSSQVSRISTIPIQTGPTASYHVPRGAAVVAAMSAPRSSVATPVLRGTPQSLPMNARAVLPAGVQPPRPTAKIPSHHVSTMRGRGVAVASKQQINVSGRLLGPTLVAASRPPHTTIITSNVTKPVMLSSTTMVRAPLPGQATAKIFQTDTTKIFQQSDQSSAKIYQTSDQPKIYQSVDPTGVTKIYQSDQAKIYQQSDQSTTTAKLLQTDQGTTTRIDQSTSTSAKLFPTVPEGTTVKVYQTTDQSGNLQTKLYHASTDPASATKIFTPTEPASQQPQPIYIQHKPQIGKYFTGSMYMSQTGSGSNSGGVVMASGISQGTTVVLPQHHSQHHSIQSHPTVLQPQQMGHGSQAHGTTIQGSHGAMIVAQHQGTSVLGSQHVQHGSIVPHNTIVQQSQPHGTTMVQTHVGLVQQPQTPIGVQQSSGGLSHGNPTHITVSGSGQTHSMVVAPQSHGKPHGQSQSLSLSQPNPQSSQYIDISRPRPATPQSQPSTSIQQNSSCQVMRFNPVVVVEPGRTPFQGLINATSSVSSLQSDSATLTALPSGVQSIVQPNIQGIAMSSNQPQQTATLHPMSGVGQQVNISGQIAGLSGSVSIPAGSIPASSIPPALSSAVAQSLTPKQNTSPRPSILRKRDNTESWSGNLKAQRNLGPVLSGLNMLSTPPSQLSSMQNINAANSSSSSSAPGLVQTPVTPQTQPIPDDDAPLGSGGSSTLSAASSPDQAPIVDQPSPVTVSSVIPTSSSLSSSPRKKPRKQQLPHNPPPSRPSPFSDEDMQFLSDKPNSKDYLEEDKKKRMSLLKTYKQGWKPANNHFLRYCDVRTKEEKKLTLTELANQKNATSIINGWKVYHLLSQIDDLVNTETEYCDLFTSLLNTMEERQQKIKNKNPEKKTDEILNRLNERIKANAQRCKVVNDHMHEARGQFMKLFDHKTYVADLITRFANKRPVKKRERV